MRLLIFFITFLYSLEINVNFFKAKKTYEILTIYNDFPFICKRYKNKVKCIFDKLPSTPVFKSNTIYFKINPSFKDNIFIIDFNIKSKTFLIKSFEDNLYNNPLIGKELKKAKKWVIIAGDDISFIDTKKTDGLNFYFRNSPKLYIGAIDENGNPLTINKESKDILKYFEIKKAYEKGLNVLQEIDNFIKNYPNSVFLPDIEYLKLEILDSMNNSDEVISLGKKWIKKYAFNEHLPKVLLLIAKNYTKLGFLSDASYFYERILTEYPNTKESFLAMIYWADQMYMSGDSKKAFKLYEQALYNTKDIDIASLAAMRLAQRYMDKGDIKKAVDYYKKVFEANKEFILKDKQKAFELAKSLAAHNFYSLAIEIGESLIKKLKKLDDLYEPLEYYLALWSYENKDYKKALYWINRYLNEFPYGDYSEQVSNLRDKVLFEVEDGNLTKQLANINEIIEKYKGEDIAKKAFYKKILLLEKMKKYEEILKEEQNILNNSYFKNPKEFIKKIAKEYAISLFENKNCVKLIEIVKKYKIILDKKYDEKLYNCAIKVREYELASVICNKYLNSPDDKIFTKWMKRKIKALEGMKDYKNLIIAIDDLCQVEKKCYNYQLIKFFALWELKEYKKALKVAKILEQKEDIRNSDAFIKIVRWALKNSDYLTASLYAKKIIDLQNKFKVYPYSPFVEFIYVKYSKSDDRVKVLLDLLPRVKGEDKARAYYMLANLTKNKEYLDKCLDVNNSTLWKNLCKDAKKLF